MVKHLIQLVKIFQNDLDKGLNDGNDNYRDMVKGIEQKLVATSKELSSAKKRSISVSAEMTTLTQEIEILRNKAKNALRLGNEHLAQQQLDEENNLNKKLEQLRLIKSELDNSIQKYSRHIDTVSLKLEHLKSKQILLNNGIQTFKSLNEASEQIDEVLGSEELQELELQLEASQIRAAHDDIDQALNNVARPKTNDLQKEIDLEYTALEQQQKQKRNRVYERFLGNNNKPESREKNIRLTEFKNTPTNKDDRNEELLKSLKESDGLHQQQKIKEFFNK